MGTGGSVEMKIKDELDEDTDKRLIKKHSSQPQNILPGAKPRNKNDGIKQSQSLYSLNMSGSPNPLLPATIQKENELKITKEQEIHALVRKEQKLETENNRLRVELQALNKLCQKLRIERDTATISCEDANQRAISLEQDRQKIQRQFKIFRETKESEIQALLQEKRKLEAKIHQMQAHGVATGVDHEFKSNFEAMKERSVSMIADSPTPPNHWWGAAESETNSLFGSFAQIRNAVVPENSESVAELKHEDESSAMSANANWHFTNPNYFEGSGMLLDYSDLGRVDNTCLRCYITGTPDCRDGIDYILKSEEMETLTHRCRLEGHFLSAFTLQGLRADLDHENQIHELPVAKHALEISNLVIFVVGSQAGKFAEVEYELLNQESIPKNTRVLYLTKQDQNFEGDQNTNINGILSRIHADTSGGKKNMKRSFFDDNSSLLKASMQELHRMARLELGVDVEGNLAVDEVGCVGDMLLDDSIEREQREIASMSESELKPVGFEKYYERLDDFVSSPGPTPPFLISGGHGSGKTTLIKSWLERLRSMQQTFLVFQHYLTSCELSTADPVMMMRRLLYQIAGHLPSYLVAPSFILSSYDADYLRVSLLKWLDRLSSVSNKPIILAIDSIDKVLDVTKHFKWLLDPLPVGVRVIVSVDVDACPVVWTQWPTVHLEALSTLSIQSMMNGVFGPRRSGSHRSWENEINAHCRTNQTGAPLYVSLLLRVLSSSCSTSKKSLVKRCLKTQTCYELYGVLLDYIEEECGGETSNLRDRLIETLKLVVCCRSGVNENEIVGIVQGMDWGSWVYIRLLLTQYFVIREISGLLQPCNSQIESVVRDKLFDMKTRKRCTSSLVKFFTHHSSPKYRRTAEIVPWLVCNVGRKNDLQMYLLHPYMFHNLYLSGRAGEIIHYWQQIGEDKSSIVERYQDLLANLHSPNEMKQQKRLFLEEDPANLDSQVIADIYESVGRFLRDLSVMDVAVTCIERSMEIRESELDPDHHLVANCLHYLGTVYIKWKKYTMAEPLLKHALELVECEVGREHPRIIEELQALGFAIRRQERHEEAELISSRISTLQDRSGDVLFTSARFIRLRKQTARLEELAMEEESVRVSNIMNDLGVLSYVQKNYSSAASFLTRSLAMRKKFLGENHANVAQCLHNLSGVYNEQKEYVKATECMRKSLDIRKEVFGRHSPIVLSTAKNLAILCKKSQQYDAARLSYRELLDASKEIHGDDHKATGTAMLNLAVVESQLGNHQAALPLYQQALAIYENRCGEWSKEVADTLRNIAILRYESEQFEEAAELYKRSLSIKEKLKAGRKKTMWT